MVTGMMTSLGEQKNEEAFLRGRPALQRQSCVIVQLYVLSSVIGVRFFIEKKMCVSEVSRNEARYKQDYNCTRHNVYVISTSYST